jgi:hypothetical protein
MADLLRRLQKQNVAVDYIENILAAFSEDDQRVVPGAIHHGQFPDLPIPTSASPPVSDSPHLPTSAYPSHPTPLIDPLTQHFLIT